MEKVIEIRHALCEDKAFWFSLDRHLPESEFEKKVRDRQGYVLSVDGRRAGILRYQLFWDNTPFCTMLYLDEKHRNLGYGTLLMNFWESEMRTQGFNLLLVSTRSDEGAQHFFHKLGYTDSGCLLTPDQPTELFLSKRMKAV